MSKVKFKATETDYYWISKIVERVKPCYEELDLPFIKLDFEMDMVAAHSNGCPIDFKKLYEADEFTFHHDVAGIRGSINRETGKLENNFIPRCAK